MVNLKEQETDKYSYIIRHVAQVDGYTDHTKTTIVPMWMVQLCTTAVLSAMVLIQLKVHGVHKIPANASTPFFRGRSVAWKLPC